MLWIHYNYNSWIINNNKTSIKTLIWKLKRVAKKVFPTEKESTSGRICKQAKKKQSILKQKTKKRREKTFAFWKKRKNCFNKWEINTQIELWWRSVERNNVELKVIRLSEKIENYVSLNLDFHLRQLKAKVTNDKRRNWYLEYICILYTCAHPLF